MALRSRSISPSLDVDVGHAEERGDRLLGRSGEVGLDDVCKHVLARELGGLRRIVHVARAVFLEADQLLLAEDPQHGAHGGVGGRIGEVAHDLGHRGLAALMEDVHDLPLAAGQGMVGLLLHEEDHRSGWC